MASQNIPTGKIILKPRKEKPVHNKHPWIFSGAIRGIEGTPSDGDLVTIYDHQSSFLAQGYLNRRSQIAVRILSWEQDASFDRSFFENRIKQAIAARSQLAESHVTDSYRIIYGESDLLPGLIVDRYGSFLVLQALTLGIERRKRLIVEILADLLNPKGIYERSDAISRRKEGLDAVVGLLEGIDPPDLVEILENEHRFLVDIKRGQKTGFYLDQRENRHKISRYCSNARVLNCFCYTGGHAIYAAKAGAAEIVNVDSSEDALKLSADNLHLNAIDETTVSHVNANVFDLLRTYWNDGQRFDVVVLDPPKFAHSKSDVSRAARGYKDINLSAMRILNEGGILATFSCSGSISLELFQKILFGASVDASRDVSIIETLGHSADHPILLTFPEAAYLKGFVCRVR